MMGIYMILSRESGKVYVGSAVDFDRRWSQHRRSLRTGKHHSAHLQSAWLARGETDFVFLPLETVHRKEDLIRVEQGWIDRLFAADPSRGYNMSPSAKNASGVKHTPQARKNMADSRRGAKHSDETRRKLSEAAKSRAPMSAESRAKISDHNRTRRGVPKSPEWVAKMTGRTRTEETRAKMSLSAKLRGKDKGIDNG